VALKVVLAKCRLGREVLVLPTEKAYGRISAKNLLASTAVPAFATSHMDGFAVKAFDLLTATEARPVSLEIKGEVRLGLSAKLTIRRGEAALVATGARIPAGTDTVIPAENTHRSGTKLFVNFRPERGSFVFRTGKDVRKGELVLSEGQVIRAQDIGLLLSLGLTTVSVWARPRVSVIATGGELTRKARPKPGLVRDSHSSVFLRLVEALACEPVDLGLVKDDPKEVAKIVRRGLAHSDFVLTLGGTSAGKRDFVGDAIKVLHPDVVFHGIKMDRGRVTGVAVVRGKPILMMPGPIQGAMNAFILFGVPIINALTGRVDVGLEVSCRFDKAWVARRRFPNFRKVVYVKLWKGDEMVAEPLAGETESVKVLSDADGFIIVPESVTRIEKGSMVQVQLLPGFSFT
jgi:molybdenum cofactor synthesis domain-containing protein